MSGVVVEHDAGERVGGMGRRRVRDRERAGDGADATHGRATSGGSSKARNDRPHRTPAARGSSTQRAAAVAMSAFAPRRRARAP